MALPTYLTASEATTLANQLPGLASFKAATDAAKLAALTLASSRFDTARRYQGRKYAIDQVLEFPRIPYSGVNIPLNATADLYGYTSQVWGWDWTNNVAIVPDNVKLAVLYEADAITNGLLEQRRKDIHSGLTSQSVGGNSESYAPLGANGLPKLCCEADVISKQYELRSGRIL